MSRQGGPQREVYEARGAGVGASIIPSLPVRREHFETDLLSDTQAHEGTHLYMTHRHRQHKVEKRRTNILVTRTEASVVRWQAVFALEQTIAAIGKLLTLMPDMGVVAGERPGSATGVRAIKAPNTNTLDELERQLNAVLLACKNSGRGLDDKERAETSLLSAQGVVPHLVQRRGPLLSSSLRTTCIDIHRLLQLRPDLRQLKRSVDCADALAMLADELVPQDDGECFHAAVAVSRRLDDVERQLAVMEHGVAELQKVCAEVRAVADDVAQSYAAKLP